MIKFINTRGDNLKKISPQLNILLSFIALILIGSILLMLPFATKVSNYTFLDSLFTATTSVTITGLTTIDVYATYTVFGKIVIALLIQLGGLSITTLMLFVLTIVGAKIGFGSRDLMSENISLSSRVGIVKLVKKIVILTFIIEFIGAVIFTSIFISEGEMFFSALGKGVFHSISSYNNAGITIFSGANSIMNYNTNPLFMLITIALIILGGIGTIVVFDVIENKRWKRLKPHSKIVIKMTLILLVIGFVFVYFTEDKVSILNSIFHSTTLRTAGFYSIDYSNVKAATLVVMIMLMFIGGSPASTAGGIKVTTLYTLIKATSGKMNHKESLVYGRKISEDYKNKALMTLIVTLGISIIGIILIALFDNKVGLDKIVFEVVSAISNTGLTLNLTNTLSSYSKIVIILLMIIGRVSAIAFISAFIFKRSNDTISIDYLDQSYLV